jgi:hypothetical protein
LFIVKRIPKWDQITPVYAVIVQIIYIWTILWFFWKLPSLLYYMNIQEILATISYIWATNLLESLVVLCGPLLLSVILPANWFRDLFIVRGTALILPGLGYLIYIAYHFQSRSEYPAVFFKPWAVSLAFSILFAFVFIAGRVNVLRKVIEFIADRAIIFLYLFIPLSLISVLSILFRLIV